MKALKSTQELILNDSFLNYVFKKNSVDIEFWEDYISNHPQHAHLIDKARKEVLDLHTAVVNIEREENYQKLKPKLVKRGKTLSLKKYISIAAVIAISLASVLFIYNYKYSNKYHLVYEAGVSEKETIILQDGSKVILNSESQLIVAEGFGVTNRKIDVEGEIYIDVAKNPNLPFVISTNRMDIRVLGTILNIRSYPNEGVVETSLIEGSAEVYLKENKNSPIRLKPSEKIVTASTDAIHKIDDEELLETFKTKNFLVENVREYDSDQKLVETSWTEQKLVFSNEPLSSIAKSLERWYGVSIEFGEENLIKKRKYTAAFDDNEKLENVLESLQASIPFSYQYLENNKIIKITN